MAKKISFSLSPSSIQSAIKEVKAYQNDLNRKTEELCRRLTAEGIVIAQAHIGNSGFGKYIHFAQTFEMGIKSSDAKEITGNLEKEYLDAIEELAGKKVDIFQLYGTQGTGEVAKYVYVGQVSATPTDVGGNDEILEMSVTIVPNTVPVKCTDDCTITDNKDGSFTVAKKA